MDKNKWDLIWDVLKHEMIKEKKLQEDFTLYHYTSLKVLFNILEGDSIWASNVRFSNDSMEEKILSLDNPYIRDDYIICFSSEGDALSQWRGYCHEGGAAIKFNFNGLKKYSILDADYEKNKKYIICDNAPIPVFYVSPDNNPEILKRGIVDTIKEKDGTEKISLEDVLPYLKNGMFYEEKELRLVFSNIGGSLSKCICFRTLENGVKIPYMIVKSGDIGKMNQTRIPKACSYTDEQIKRLIKDRDEIWIEECADQENKYYEILNQINKVKSDYNVKGTVDVFCKGHLPIEEIIVAPTHDRKRIAEQVERFCKSKYWLNNVIVKSSKIPYIGPND